MDGQESNGAPISLHARVTRELLRRIECGVWSPGAAIPTEMTLCREFGVSRITMRRAMAVLVERRLIVRRRGAGSYVTGRAPDQRAFHLVGFLDTRLPYAHRILQNAARVADGRTAAALELPVRSRVRHIRAVVHREGEPFTIVDAYTAEDAAWRADPSDFMAPIPSGHALGRRLGHRALRAEKELDAVSADVVAARHLGLAPGTAIMRARRVTYSAGDQPIQYLVVRYHPDRYRFVVDLMPRTGSAGLSAISAGAPLRKLTRNLRDKETVS